MKNRILFMLCFLIVTFSLTACEKEKPYEDTELEKETQSDINIEEVENTQEQDTSILFLGSDIVFYQVPKSTFESRIAKGHVTALIGTQVEWQKWLEQYMPEYTIQDKVFEQYNLDLFKNNYLIIYRGELGQYGHKTTGIERVFIENDDFRIEEFEFHNELLMIDSREQNYYIPYHMCWIKKNGVAEQIYEKYKVGHYYCVDGLSAYYVYMNLAKSCVETKYTHNSGSFWETQVLKTDEIDSGSSDIDTFFLNGEVGYVLHTTDAASGHMGKYLWTTTDGGRSWRQVSTLTDQIYRYPQDMIFFTEEVGCIITDYVQTPYAGNLGSIVYRTEDGGETWKEQIIENNLLRYESIRVTKIERISETEARLYVNAQEWPPKVPEEESSAETSSVYKNYVYYTQDAGATWKNLGEQKCGNE